MARPPGKTFPVPVMVKTTEAMKARLEALASRVPFDVSVGFSVVARRAIAIGLEVLERDPRLIVEPTEGDAAAARVVLSRPGLLERVAARAEAMPDEGPAAAALAVLEEGPQAPAQRAQAPKAKPSKAKAPKGSPKGAQAPEDPLALDLAALDLGELTPIDFDKGGK